MPFRRLDPFLFFWIATLSFLAGCATSSGGMGKRLSRSERVAFLLSYGNGALMEGDPTGALSALLEAKGLQEDNPKIRQSLALAFFQKGDSDRAIVEAREAVRLDPKFTDAHATLGKLYLDQGNFVLARTHLERAAEDLTFREGYKVQTNLGILWYRLGKYEVSEKALNRAIREAPTQACAAHYYRGNIALKGERFNSALRDFDQATQKFCGSFVEAHYAQGVTLERAKRFPEAKKKYVQLKQLYPESDLADKAMERLRYLP